MCVPRPRGLIASPPLAPTAGPSPLSMAFLGVCERESAVCCVCVCVCVCLYAYTYIYVYVYIKAPPSHAHTHVYIHIQISMYTYTYIPRPVSEAPPTHASHRLSHLSKQGLIEDGLARDDLIQVCVYVCHRCACVCVSSCSI